MDVGGESRRNDLIALATVAVLVAAAIIVGIISRANHVPIHARVAPLFGDNQQQVGPGTVPAIAIAAVVVWYGPAIAGRMRWPMLMLATWATSAAWIFSLGLVAGWDRLAGKLERPSEYLHEVPDAPPIGDLVAGFADRIVDGQPDSWTTHVAGHPPGALISFILLDRVGLGGGAWAAIVVGLAGATASLAIAVTLRAVDAELMARHAVPFLVLAPAAIWIGISGDGLFLAVSAWGIALLAIACTRRTAPSMALAAVAAGLVLGLSLFLSYGLVLLGTVALAVLLVTRRLVPGVIAVAAVGGVVVAFGAAGFWWWDGMDALAVRYYQGWGSSRPYSYWVWANLAAVVLAAGPAVAPGIRRAVAALVAAATPPLRVDHGRSLHYKRSKGGIAHDQHRVAGDVGGGAALAALVVGALVAIVIADLSGLSKGEVERIWLPFTAWLVTSCALLPLRDHRWWLALQAATALAIIHLTLPAF